MTIAHASLGVVVAGITAASAWQTESIRMMRPDDVAFMAGYEFTFDGVEPVTGPNYDGMRGAFTVTRNGALVVRLLPEKRNYTAERSATTEAAIHTTWSGDLYAVLGEAGEGDGWSVRLYHNPLVSWIWIGAVLMALGGLVSLTDRRHRVGAPRRATRAPGAAAGAGPASPVSV
jgi:cytochrome c-type biogenesis protein CcmF